MSNQTHNSIHSKEVQFFEGIRFSIRLSEIPTESQFARATAEAQSLALISLLKLEYQELGYAMAALTSLSRNIRRQLFEYRAILCHPDWPALRLIGAKNEIEETLWAYLSEAKEAHNIARATKAEQRIAILNTRAKESRAYNGYIEVSTKDSQRTAKVEAKEKRAQAKTELSGILTDIMEGRLAIKTSLLSLLKELVRGENLATCPAALRNKINIALRATNNKHCIAFADVLAASYDPFLAKGQELELDTLILEPSTRSELESTEAPVKQKRSLAEIIAAKKANTGV